MAQKRPAGTDPEATRCYGQLTLRVPALQSYVNWHNHMRLEFHFSKSHFLLTDYSFVPISRLKTPVLY